MAERKSGPVKPPVIDLKARPAEPSPPASGASGGTASAPDPKAIEAPRIAASLAAPATTPKAAAKEEVIVAGAPANRTEKPTDRPGPSTPAAAAPPGGEPKTPDAPKPAADKPEPPKPPPGAGAAKPPGSAPATGQGGTGAPGREPRLWPAALAGALGGAVIGIAICYGLAAAGYWPGSDAAGLRQRLAQIAQADTATQTRLTALGSRLDALQNGLTPRLTAAESNIAAIEDALKPLRATPADVAGTTAQLKSLSSRLDAVAAGASSADAAALAASVKTAQQNLAALTQKVDALTGREGATAATVAALRTELDGAKAAIAKAAAAPSPQTIAAALQLPILISALDADFAAGRPYAADLKALTAALPKAAVPASVTAAAATGLPAAADVTANFEAKMPDMIAAEPGSSTAGWQDQLAGWARSVLALRKTGAEPGSGPDALLSQLEAAVARHDFARAAALLDKLPPPMQRAAGTTAGQIRTLADAGGFITGLRQKALAPVGGASS